MLALVLPDGTIGQGDRQHSAWAYSGILASGGAGATAVPVFYMHLTQQGIS